VYALSLIEVVRCHLRAAGAMPTPLREVLEARLTYPRKPRGVQHRLSSLVAGVACGYSSTLAIASVLE
jgi:hypothetical protein